MVQSYGYWMLFHHYLSTITHPFGAISWRILQRWRASSDLLLIAPVKTLNQLLSSMNWHYLEDGFGPTESAANWTAPSNQARSKTASTQNIGHLEIYTFTCKWFYRGTHTPNFMKKRVLLCQTVHDYHGTVELQSCMLEWHEDKLPKICRVVV